jgi:hypothetical protein
MRAPAEHLSLAHFEMRGGRLSVRNATEEEGEGFWVEDEITCTMVMCSISRLR